jgi:OOP family OmpA-OmpF porin
MPDPSAFGIPKEDPKDPSQDAHKYVELRKLLVGREQQLLMKLQERLEDPKRYAEDVSQVLPQAIRIRSAQDDQLNQALMASIEGTIKLSVQKNSEVLANAFFPIIGPAIRKAIVTALKEMLQSFNQALDRSFSWQGLKWRLEAYRTGKPFAEVVLLHSIVYRVEQVFLIHKKTGLLLQHIAADLVATQDADLVSGMLTAIRDFVHDSFGVGQGDSLETLQVGELLVWIEQGPHAILAGVIRGNPPQDLKLVFQEAIENIHLAYGGALESFTGDATPLEACRPILEACLQARYEMKKQKSSASPLVWSFWIIMLGALLTCSFFFIRNHHRWTNYVEKLRSEPGIVVTDATSGWWKYSISGLRDPLAPDPVTFLREANIDPKKVTSQWKPYQTLHPKFILARAEYLLKPPETISLKFEDGVLYATGSAPRTWIVEARKLARAVSGITKFQENNLVDENLIKSKLHMLKMAAEDMGYRWLMNFKMTFLSFHPWKRLDTYLGFRKEQAKNQISPFLEQTTQWIVYHGHALEELIEDTQKLLRAGLRIGKRAWDDLRWRNYVEKLSSEPGIRVISTKKRAGKYFISGLRDPLAADPLTLLKDTNLNSGKIISRWELYESMHPTFIRTKARDLLEPPETIDLKFENGVLIATGSASHQWLVIARKRALNIPGVVQFQENWVLDIDLQELERYKEEVEKQTLRFLRASIELVPGQNAILDTLVTEIQKLYNIGQKVGREIRIEIIGHTDSAGSEGLNRELSQKRADYVLSILVSKGLTTTYLTATGIGKREPLREELTEEDRDFNRRVSFKVIVLNTND